MTDIVKRLRDPSKGSPRWQDTMLEAADEIERLRAALGEMVTTFYDAGCHVCGGDCASANPPVGGCPIGAIERARALLAEGGR